MTSKSDKLEQICYQGQTLDKYKRVVEEYCCFFERETDWNLRNYLREQSVVPGLLLKEQAMLLNLQIVILFLMAKNEESIYLRIFQELKKTNLREDSLLKEFVEFTLQIFDSNTQQAEQKKSVLDCYSELTEKIQDLEGQIRKLQAKLLKKQTEIEQCQKQTKQQKTKIEELLKENEHLNLIISDHCDTQQKELELKLASTLEQNKKLKVELLTTQNLLQEKEVLFERQLQNMQSDMQQVLEKNQKMSEQSAQKENTFVSKSQHEELQVKLIEIKKKLMQAENSLLADQSKNLQLESKIRVLNQSIEQQTIQLEEERK